MEILQQIIDMDKAAAARVNAAIEEERRLSDESGEGSVEERGNTLAEECGKLDEKFAANRNKWKAEIIGRITEG